MTTPSGPKRPLPPQEIQDALTQLPDWRHRQTGIYTAYACSGSAAAVELMGRIGAACEELDHHPDLDWRYDHLFLESSSHDTGGAVTTRDLRLARRISELAAAAGATAVPDLNRVVDVALDTRDAAALEEFWSTALGYVKDERLGELRDPQRRGPGFWFQETGSPDAHPMHLDITGPPESWRPARERLASLAPDRPEDDRFAPRWWIHTDADGNRVCLCSGLDEPGGLEGAGDPDA